MRLPFWTAEAETRCRHVSLTVNAGDKIAVVGYNGAGKTTLIKLIMRLYDPTDGVILYNGVDIREYDVEAYRRKSERYFRIIRFSRRL